MSRLRVWLIKNESENFSAAYIPTWGNMDSHTWFVTHDLVVVPTVDHPNEPNPRTCIVFLSLTTCLYCNMKEESPLTLPNEKQPDWLLSTLQSVGSTHTSAFKNKISIPSHLQLSPKALEAANQQLNVLGGDRHIFGFSAQNQGTLTDIISKGRSFM